MTYATAKELHAEAVALGCRVKLEAVRKRVQGETDDVMRARFVQEALYDRLLAAHDIEQSQHQASLALAAADWSAEVAAAKVIARTLRQRGRRKKACEEPARSAVFVNDIQALALCGCTSCEGTLVVALNGFIVATIRDNHWMGAIEDIEQEAVIAIGAALDAWDPDRGPFLSFFPHILRHRATALVRRATARSRRAFVVSLDAETVGRDRWAGRSPSTESVVLLREHVRERIASVRDACVAAVDAFEARQVVVA